MKKNHLFRATTVIMALVIVASCGGLKKMAKNISLVTFTSTPKPLVMQAGKVTLNMTAAFPAKYFDPKAVVEVTPVLNYGEQKKELKPITLQGEKVQNNFTKVSTMFCVSMVSLLMTFFKTLKTPNT